MTWGLIGSRMQTKFNTQFSFQENLCLQVAFWPPFRPPLRTLLFLELRHTGEIYNWFIELRYTGEFLHCLIELRYTGDICDLIPIFPVLRNGKRLSKRRIPGTTPQGQGQRQGPRKRSWWPWWSPSSQRRWHWKEIQCSSLGNINQCHCLYFVSCSLCPRHHRTDQGTTPRFGMFYCIFKVAFLAFATWQNFVTSYLFIFDFDWIVPFSWIQQTYKQLFDLYYPSQWTHWCVWQYQLWRSPTYL